MSVSPSSMVSRHVSKKVKAQPRRRVSSSLKTAGGSEHRAKIEHLFPIPLELHFEILWDLGPNDLLNLARTNKSFRALLRDKACDVYWKAALKTYGFLPHRPPGMPLRMFASLAFETFCQRCFSDEICRAYYVDFVHFVRLCISCFEKRFVEHPRCPRGINDIAWKNAQRLTGYYVAPDMARILSHRRSLRMLTKALREVPPQYQDQDLSDFLASLNRRGVQPKTWFNRLVDEKRREHQAMIKRKDQEIRHRRFERILAHLKQIGYEQPLANTDIRQSLEHLRLVDVAQELDCAEWLRIKVHIINHVENRAYRAALDKRFISLAELLFGMESEFPDVRSHNNHIDIALLPEVKRVLDVRYEREISELEWDNLRKVIPVAFIRWRRTVDSKLAKSHPALAPVFKQFGTLDHPATVFACRQPACNEISRSVAYAELSSHACCNERTREYETLVSFEGSVYKYPAMHYFQHEPWSARTLTIHGGSDKVKDIMRACGADPNRTSWDKMDNKNIRLHCATCGESEVRGVTMGWRTAVDHALFKHDSILRVEWRRASKTVSIQARQLEKRTEEISRSAYPEHGTCGLCEDQDLEQHGDKKALAFSKYCGCHINAESQVRPYVPMPVAILPGSHKASKRLTRTEQVWLEKGLAAISSVG